MSLHVLSNEFESFWHDQNQRLLAHPAFISEGGDLFEDTLCFKDTKGFISRLDLSAFDSPHIQLVGVAFLNIKGNIYPLSLKEYVKLFILSAMSPRTAYPAVAVYKFMMHVSAFLNSRKELRLTKNNMEDFHVSFLTQSVNKVGFHRQLSPPSFRGSYGAVKLSSVRNKLNNIGITGVIGDDLTQKNIESTLSNACQPLLGIGLNEYKGGGSYNFLGLELGQYYIDYMRQVYEQDYFYTLICRKTIEKITSQFAFERSNKYWSRVFIDTIQGTYSGNKHDKSTLVRTRTAVHHAIDAELFSQYNAHLEKTLSFNEEYIHELVQELGLEMRFDAVEIVRILMLKKYYPIATNKTAEQVWQNYLSSLDRTFIDSVTVASLTSKDVYTKMTQLILKKKLDKESFMKSLKDWVFKLLGGSLADNFSHLLGEMERVTHAMTSLAVSWLGYRKSEFGFPLDAINAEPNMDILDNSHVPFRFKLKWFVPKTNGTTKLDREITSQCYQLSAQLNDLFQATGDMPCLYESLGSSLHNTASNYSTAAIELRVSANWISFVNFYQPFEDVATLYRLSKVDMERLSSSEVVNLKLLQGKYDLSSSRAKHILDACNEVRGDLFRLRCSTIVGGSRSKIQNQFKASLVELNETGRIEDKRYAEVVENYLSVETNEWLMSGNINLDRKMMADISKELLQGVRYPSPHAFRHIWAEAVLTRYQGDVGAVIRHQFCHLDDSFFMAYLKGKEPQHLMKAARITVLNSIVDTLLIDSKSIGQAYLGGFSRYVQKASQLTKAVSSTELLVLREKISGRVISIQPSHFATCIPREGAESRAKCAEFGDINPHNAKPEFCLNCIHAMIVEGNLKGIWMTIQPFVKEALNTDIMGFMLEQHLPILRSGYKRIKELKSGENSENVMKILHVIEEAIASIETKLQDDSPYAY
ncbi:hypothetical protein [Vibrio coralliirubri]|uniref:hypothetical protein n=1 Tax=Vibrio coralliirubri TaxID=1516159 RepID=UPI000636F0B4|nr:hypothetical protein [Vibrio coralliirubri]CDU01626.1 conserved hypothetical protein [Vibrio coralliirubri]